MTYSCSVGQEVIWFCGPKSLLPRWQRAAIVPYWEPVESSLQIHTTFLKHPLHCHRPVYTRVGNQKGRPTRKWKHNIRMGLNEIMCNGVDQIYLAKDKAQWRVLMNTVRHLGLACRQRFGLKFCLHFSFLIRAKCLIHINLLYLITLTVFDEAYKLWSTVM